MTELLIATELGFYIAMTTHGHWQARPSGLEGRHVTTVVERNGTIVAGTTHGIFRSHDSGATWQESSQGLTPRHVRWIAFAPDQRDLLFAGTEPATICVSHDGGSSWQPCPEVAALRDEHGWYLPYSDKAGCVRSFAFHGSRGYAAVEVGGLLRSDDGGATWQLAPGSDGKPHIETPWEGPIVHPDIHAATVHPSDPNLVFLATNGGLLRSRDGGATWERLSDDSYCRDLWVDPSDPDHILLGHATRRGWRGSIQETRDGGQTWRDTASHLGTPWDDALVERMVWVGDGIVAILDNGHLLHAPLDTLDWQPILEAVTLVTAAYCVPRQKRF